MNRATTLLALSTLAALAACSPTLSARSVAPPGRTARLESIDGFWTVKAYKLELSRGVAIALGCERSGPCQQLRARSDDPAIATVHIAGFGELEAYGYAGARVLPAGLVIVGHAPGTTRIRLDTRHGGRNVFVTIVAPPVTNVQTAVAR